MAEILLGEQKFDTELPMGLYGIGLEPRAEATFYFKDAVSQVNLIYLEMLEQQWNTLNQTVNCLWRPFLFWLSDAVPSFFKPGLQGRNP